MRVSIYPGPSGAAWLAGPALRRTGFLGGGYTSHGPFLFLIREKATGDVFLMGRFSRPDLLDKEAREDP